MLWPLMIASGVMLLICALCLFWPRRSRQQSLSNTALFEQRLQALALARDNGELAESDFVQAANELKLQFVSTQPQSTANNITMSRLLAGLMLVAIMVIVGGVYAFNGNYSQLQQWQLAQDNLQLYGERALLQQGEPLSAEEVELFALALRTKLAKEGDDAIAWMLLGRIRLSQGFPEQAVDAFEKALAISPDRTAVLLSYSQALIIVGDEQSLALAGRAVARVLINEPKNSDALSLMALIAYENGDMEQAKQAWIVLLAELETDDPRYAAVQQRLSELGVDVQVDTRRITVDLFVDPALQQANPEATLFLFARAKEGPALPLAVQRIPLVAGQQQLVLQESMAMQPGWSLANAEQIEVVARMSISGTVEQRPGDVQAVSDVLSFEQPQISIKLTLEP
ncbi:c-type cytochrome biogenesis protein CcmI [Rheinheimera salexigens]|uniref:C-type cytochrome biogenesis protein CcmI n=1 Tax=Rheinheimera salexigens TaxID=1628148 RepID=A0A1E7Q877_9GAMM|nr:c-type cytochrome biogenesis protein CcmI [Rheinheimera salexigens]OEY70248.1 c-type cytochrome biogenesis protein CcmI [Rheinheimera salexigens]